MRRISEVAVDRVLVRVGTERIGVGEREGERERIFETMTHCCWRLGGGGGSNRKRWDWNFLVQCAVRRSISILLCSRIDTRINIGRFMPCITN